MQMKADFEFKSIPVCIGNSRPHIVSEIDPTIGKAQMVCTAGRGKQTTVTGLSGPANRSYHRVLAPYTAEQMVKWLNHVCLGKD